MKNLQIVLPLCALLVTSAATAAPATAGAGAFGASPGAGGQTIGQAALVAREGYSGSYAYEQVGQVHRIASGYRGPLSFRDRELLKLHALALKLQKEDGGTLTPDDQVYLQARLNSILSP